jgi:hypothetical protein
LSNPGAIFAGSPPRFTRSRVMYEAYVVSRTSTRPQVDSTQADGATRHDTRSNVVLVEVSGCDRRHRCSQMCRQLTVGKQRHSHRFPIPSDAALTILCQGWRSHHVPSCISLVWSDRIDNDMSGPAADRREAQVADPRAAVSRAGPHADRGPGQRSPRCSGGRAGRRRAARLTVYRELAQREGKGRKIGSSLTSH